MYTVDEKNIFKIVKIGKDEITLMGTGFFVRYNAYVYVISASHVFEKFELSYGEKYAILSSLFFYEGKAFFHKIDEKKLVLKNNSKFSYDFDLAVYKLCPLAMFENDGINLIDLNNGCYTPKISGRVLVKGYPDFYNEKYSSVKTDQIIPPLSIKSTILTDVSIDKHYLISNDTGNINFGGMSGAPVCLGGKLVGVFCGAAISDEGFSVFRVCKIGFIAFVIDYVLKKR